MYVHILGTGGTISSRTREGSGATATDGAASLAGMLTAEVRTTDVLTTGSYLLTFADLRILVKAVQEALADDELPDEYATRIEISLSEERGGVAIHVEESGLASVSDDEAEARQAYEDEVGMWEQVLSAAKNYLEGR